MQGQRRSVRDRHPDRTGIAPRQEQEQSQTDSRRQNESQLHPASGKISAEETADPHADRRSQQQRAQFPCPGFQHELGIQNDRIRKSLADDIMGDDGLKWKDGGFYGLDEYLARLNEKEHLYKTEEEKKLEEQQAAARSKLPTFTDRSRGKDTGDGEKKDIPVIW